MSSVSCILASWRQQERERTALAAPANNQKSRKEQTKVLVLMSVSLHENASHTFSALHAALVPYLMWVNTEQGHEEGVEPVPLTPQDLDGLSVLGHVVRVLKGKIMDDSVLENQVEFIDENKNLIYKKTPLRAGLGIS